MTVKVTVISNAMCALGTALACEFRGFARDFRLESERSITQRRGGAMLEGAE